MSEKHSVILVVGSSGTRIFVYEAPATNTPRPDEIRMPSGWNFFGSETEKAIHTISTISTTTIKAYLEPLFEHARGYLPKGKKPFPLFLLPTAGMRALNSLGDRFNTLTATIQQYIEDVKDDKGVRFKLQVGDTISRFEELSEWVAMGHSCHADLLCQYYTDKNIEDDSKSAIIIVAAAKSTRIYFYTWSLGDGAKEVWASIKIIGDGIHTIVPKDATSLVTAAKAAATEAAAKTAAAKTSAAKYPNDKTAEQASKDAQAEEKTKLEQATRDAQEAADNYALTVEAYLQSSIDKELREYARSFFSSAPSSIPIFFVAKPSMQSVRQTNPEGTKLLYSALEKAFKSKDNEEEKKIEFKVEECDWDDEAFVKDRYLHASVFSRAPKPPTGSKFLAILAGGARKTWVYVYKGGSAIELLGSAEINGGIHAENTRSIVSYLKPLLDKAQKFLPLNAGAIPLRFFATGGMRSLQRKQPDRFNALCDGIREWVKDPGYHNNTWFDMPAGNPILGTDNRQFGNNSILEAGPDGDDGYADDSVYISWVLNRFFTLAKKYAVILDAGSSGSRIFVYEWMPKIRTVGLPDGIRIPAGWDDKQSDISGGISELAPTTSPKAAAKKTTADVKGHLGPLLEYAHRFLPEDTRSIPLFLLATAGMRRLEERNREGYSALLQTIEKCIKDAGFKMEEVATITGEEEGLFGWIAANYTTQRFHTMERTSGFMEIGGQSAQIAFCPNRDDFERYKGSLMQVAIGNQMYNVFSKTWLGLGANAVYEHHQKNILESKQPVVFDPCLPKEYSYQLEDKTVIGTGNFKECEEEILSIYRQKLASGDRSCCLLLQDAPGLGFDTDSQRQFLGASVYWYATHGVFGEDVSANKSYDLLDFTEEVARLYKETWAQIQVIKAHKNDKFLPRAFFQAILVLVTLDAGFGIPRQRTKDIPVTPAGGSDNTLPDPTSEVSKDNFKPLDGASWTLGRIILHAIGAEYTSRTRFGWDLEPEV